MRSRGSLLATLKEATLSHQVSMQPKAPQLLSSITSFFKQPLTESVRTAAGNQSACERKVSRRKREGLLSFFKPQSGRESKTVVRQKEMTTESAGVLSCERDHSSSMVSLETNTVILLEEVNLLLSPSVPLTPPSPPPPHSVSLSFPLLPLKVLLHFLRVNFTYHILYI